MELSCREEESWGRKGYKAGSKFQITYLIIATSRKITNFLSLGFLKRKLGSFSQGSVTIKWNSRQSQCIQENVKFYSHMSYRITVSFQGQLSTSFQPQLHSLDAARNQSVYFAKSNNFCFQKAGFLFMKLARKNDFYFLVISELTIPYFHLQKLFCFYSSFIEMQKKYCQ